MIALRHLSNAYPTHSLCPWPARGGKDIKGFNPIKGGGARMGISENDRLAIDQQKRRSREAMGTPPPTRVRSGSGGRGEKNRRILDRSIANDIPAENFIQLHPHTSAPIPGAPRLATSMTAHVPVKLQPRAEHHPIAPVKTFTKEQIADMNFQRDSHPSSDIGEAAALAASGKGIATGMGTIEAALEDAKKKAQHFTREVQRCQLEAERWRAVVDSLHAALGLATQRTPPALATAAVKDSPSTRPAMRPRGFWKEAIKAYMTVVGVPTAKNIMVEDLSCKHNASRDNVSQAIYKAINEELLIEVDGKLALASWTEASHG
jgi:hypothetical protein